MFYSFVIRPFTDGTKREQHRKCVQYYTEQSFGQGTAGWGPSGFLGLSIASLSGLSEEDRIWREKSQYPHTKKKQNAIICRKVKLELKNKVEAGLW